MRQPVRNQLWFAVENVHFAATALYLHLQKQEAVFLRENVKSCLSFFSYKPRSKIVAAKQIFVAPKPLQQQNKYLLPQDREAVLLPQKKKREAALSFQICSLSLLSRTLPVFALLVRLSLFPSLSLSPPLCLSVRISLSLSVVV